MYADEKKMYIGIVQAKVKKVQFYFYIVFILHWLKSNQTNGPEKRKTLNTLDFSI